MVEIAEARCGCGLLKTYSGGPADSITDFNLSFAEFWDIRRKLEYFEYEMNRTIVKNTVEISKMKITLFQQLKIGT